MIEVPQNPIKTTMRPTDRMVRANPAHYRMMMRVLCALRGIFAG
ncbi:hypothetical protein [Roseibium sp. RKSG952]|nr:hypothetical protein [Roseibium sp. RKSG952]